ncbi:MAG: hypothetical protein ACI8Z7_000685 [Candidatus Nanohaloarchaea archaeon]|jgi:hypothetical protein
MMKGQFMLIASILMGFIVISTASTISEVQERSYGSDDTGKVVEMVKDSAEKVDHSDEREVENFKLLISSVSGYETETVHWDSEGCFNVTLSSSDKQMRLNCIG